MSVDVSFNPPSFTVRTTRDDNGHGFFEMSDGLSSVTVHMTRSQFDELLSSLVLANLHWKESVVSRLCRHCVKSGFASALQALSSVKQDRIEEIADQSNPSISEVDSLFKHVDEFPGIVSNVMAAQDT